jgi:hypothetical protein
LPPAVFHAVHKAMFVGSFAIMRLICSFHSTIKYSKK